jgi:hypothetical protein
MDPDVIPSPGNLQESIRNQSNSVEWLNPTRSDRIRYRIDGPGYVFVINENLMDQIVNEVYFVISQNASLIFLFIKKCQIHA